MLCNRHRQQEAKLAHSLEQRVIWFYSMMITITSNFCKYAEFCKSCHQTSLHWCNTQHEYKNKKALYYMRHSLQINISLHSDECERYTALLLYTEVHKCSMSKPSYSTLSEQLPHVIEAPINLYNIPPRVVITV